VSVEDELLELVASCAADPLRFVHVAFPWGEAGSELEHQAGPDDWQREVLESVRDGLMTPGEAIQAAIASGHGVGKMHGYDYVVETPSGRKRWGDLGVGDMLFGADGSPTRIVGQQHFKSVPMYRVTFDDRTTCEVSSGHLWNVRGRQHRRWKRDGWRTMETIEILERGVKRSNGIAEARQWEIPAQGAARYPYRPVPIDAYILGLWLGDGGRNTGIVTNADAEIGARITSAGYTFSIGGKQNSKAKSLCIYGLRVALRNLGLLTKYAYEKRVPELYMINSINVRAEILRGLMDTDGECGKANGCVQFCSTSKGLIDDVIWLARSLGGKAMLSPSVKYPFYRDSAGIKIFCRPAWRCTITMPSDFRTFYIERKQRRVPKVEPRYLARWIDSIEYIGEADGMCVTVEAADGLYMANDFIVTHNSCLVAWLIEWAVSTHEDTRGVVTANTDTQLRTKTWAELAKWHRLSICRHWFTLTATAIYSVDPQHEKTWRIDMVPWSERNTEAFAGLHNKGKRILVVFDESSAIPDVIWETTEGALTDEGTEIVWLVAGNPTRNTGRFRECFGRFKHRWRLWQVDSRTARMTNKEQIAKWVADFGEDSDFVRVRVKGVFPRASSAQFIPSDVIEEATVREVAASIYDALVIGVDVARYGDDQSVIYFRKGRDGRAMAPIKLRGLDTMQLAARVAEQFDAHQADGLFVDETGVGAGVVDRLRQMGYPVIGINFGAKADRTMISTEVANYANKRAEMWGEMREWLKGGAVPNDQELRDDLGGVEYGFVLREGRDAILLESKESMKARGLASPDMGDALALTFAYPCQPRPRAGFQGAAVIRGSNRAQTEYDPFNPPA
jgi:hypothetical protein